MANWLETLLNNTRIETVQEREQKKRLAQQQGVAPQPQQQPFTPPSVNDVGRFFVGGASNLANTALGINGKVTSRALSGFNRLIGQNNTADLIERKADEFINNNLLRKDAGIFGAGGVYNSLDEQSKAQPLDVLKRAGGTALQAAAEVLPIGKGIQLAKGAAPLAQKAVSGAVQGGLAGGIGNTGAQLAERGNVDLREVAKSTGVGAGFGAALPLVGAGARRLFSGSTARQPVTIAQGGAQNTGQTTSPGLMSAPTIRGSLPSRLAPDPASSLRAASQDMQIPARNVATRPRTEPIPQSQIQGNAGAQERIPSYEGSIAELPTFNTKRVGKLDKAVRSTRSIIERQGESGQQLAENLRGARDSQELFLADIQKQTPNLTKLSQRGRRIFDKDYANFVDTVEGRAAPNNDLVAKAVQEWRSVAPQIRDRAVKSGLDVGDQGENYYPHVIDYDKIFSDRNAYNQALNHLVKTGQAQSAEEAIKLLGYARDVSRNREFGNLEASRLVDLPFYDKTPDSLVSYLTGASKRIANTETFGIGDEEALKLIGKIGLEGGDTEAAKNAFDIAVGARKYNPTSEAVSRGIRKYITTTRLGLGALTNTSQNVNTGIVTGHLRTLGAMVKQLNPSTRQFVADTGVISDALLNDLRTQKGVESFTGKVLGKAINRITAPGFGVVEKFNRGVAATAGRDYALRLAQKGDEATLRKLRVKGPIVNRTLTDEQQVQAARSIVEKTQFKVDPQDLPGWVDSPGGKLVAQFRTFSYNQGKFFSNEVLKPAAKGNFLPLSRVLAALPLGYALYETRRTIDGRPQEEDPTKVGLQSFSKIGGAGLALDIYQSLNPVGSKYLPPDRRVSMAVGAFGGPAVGQAASLVGGVSEAIQAKNTPEDRTRMEGKISAQSADGKTYNDLTSISRFGLQQIPVIGSPLANRLIPYKKQADADQGRPIDGARDVNGAVKDIKQERKNDLKALKDSFTPEEYEISNLNKNEQKTLIDKGLISADEIASIEDRISQKRRELGMGKATTDTKLSKDTLSYKLLEESGNLSKEEKKAWSTQPASESYKDIIANANKIKPDGSPDLPATNKVAELYANLEKDLADNPEWSEIQKDKAKKKFVNEAYDSRLTDNQKAIALLNSSDLEAAVGAGQVTQDDVKAIIELDNIRHDLGLSAYFSKKDRIALGYEALPVKGSKSGSKGTGKGRKSKGFRAPAKSKFNRIGSTAAIRRLLADAGKGL